MRCSACGKTGLRSTTIALVVGGPPTMGSCRVCSACVKRGVLIVPYFIAPVVNVEPADKKRTRDVLAPFVKLLAGQLAAFRSETFDDSADCERLENERDVRVEVYQNIVALLRSGRA